MNISPVIERHMKDSGFTAYSLAKDAGISYNGLRRVLENGKTVNLVTLIKLSETLGVDLWRLVKEAELEQ